MAIAATSAEQFKANTSARVEAPAEKPEVFTDGFG
jgi:hypothetical protein